jgi:hypothetical protein
MNKIFTDRRIAVCALAASFTLMLCGCRNDCDCPETPVCPALPQGPPSKAPPAQSNAKRELAPSEAELLERFPAMKFTQSVQPVRNRLNVPSIDRLRKQLDDLNTGYVVLLHRSTRDLVLLRSALEQKSGGGTGGVDPRQLADIRQIIVSRLRKGMERETIQSVLGKPTSVAGATEFYVDTFDDGLLELRHTVRYDKAGCAIDIVRGSPARRGSDLQRVDDNNPRDDNYRELINPNWLDESSVNPEPKPKP